MMRRTRSLPIIATRRGVGNVRFIRFQLERWIQGGVLQQLLLVAAIIVGISILGGVVAWLGTNAFSNVFDAIWWAFLRLTDPGYLGDDEGVVLRIVSTIVTVLGYVLFMGSLIAIMTQWLARTIERFDRGLGPIVMEGHVVLIGWTNRTPEVVRELMIARGRLRRFLAKHDRRVLRIVIVAKDVNIERRRYIRAFLGRHYRARRIFFRSGTEISRSELSRFDLPRAGAIIIPGDEFRHGDVESADVTMVKMLVALRATLDSTSVDEGPQIVAEMFDPRKLRAARGVLGSRCAIIPGDSTIAMLLVHAIRDPRLLAVSLELLTHARGCTPYVKAFPELAGTLAAEASARFSKAVVIGVVRTSDGCSVPHLNPPADFRLDRDDKLVMVARASEDLVLGPETKSEVTGGGGTLRRPESRVRRVVVLGLSSKLGSMLEELGRSNDLAVEVTVVSRHPDAARLELTEGYAWDPDQVRLEYRQADYTVLGVLDDLCLERVDTIMVLSTTGMLSAADADARTIMGYELVKSVLAERVPEGERVPEVVVELVDPASEDLLAGDVGIKVLTPRILGHLECHAALNADLGPVFSELFVGGGVEMVIREPDEYGCPSGASFMEIARAAASHGEVALGFVVGGATRGSFQVEMCPGGERRCDDSGDYCIVSLARGGDEEIVDSRSPSMQ
jgi:hypothetical protein